MTKKDIDLQLLQITQKSFPNNPTEITINSTPNDVDAWDSLGHMLFINAVETGFNLKFELEEMFEFDSIQSIAETLYNRIDTL